MGAASSNRSGVDAALQVAAPSSTAQLWRANSANDPRHHLNVWYHMNELVMASEILRNFNARSALEGEILRNFRAARATHGNELRFRAATHGNDVIVVREKAEDVIR